MSEEPLTEEERRKKAEKVRRRQMDDLRAILGTAEGRRLINRIFERAHIFHTSFTGNSHTYLNEGERNIGLWLISECEEASLDMLKDAMFLKDSDKGE